jgi:hypothetical protein
MLDEYVENELDEQTAKSLATHMATCRGCAGAHQTLRREQEIYASYLLGVEPPPDLWANLRLELEKKKVIKASQPQLQRWLATALGGLHVTPQLAAAVVLLIIGLAIGIIVWRTTIGSSEHQAKNPGVSVQPSPKVNRAGTDRDSDHTDRPDSSNDNNKEKILSSSLKGGNRKRETHFNATSRVGRRIIERSPAEPTVDQVALRAEREYLSAIEILSRDIKRRRALISPALLSQLQKTLAEIDRNITATRRAAREQPRDPVAVQYLALAYEKKVELLREVTSW